MWNSYQNKFLPTISNRKISVEIYVYIVTQFFLFPRAIEHFTQSKKPMQKNIVSYPTIRKLMYFLATCREFAWTVINEPDTYNSVYICRFSPAKLHFVCNFRFHFIFTFLFSYEYTNFIFYKNEQKKKNTTFPTKMSFIDRTKWEIHFEFHSQYSYLYIFTSLCVEKFRQFIPFCIWK